MAVLLTIEEVATYLNVSKETVYKMTQRAEIPALKVGTQWRFEQASVDEWLKSNSNQKSKPLSRKKKNEEDSQR